MKFRGYFYLWVIFMLITTWNSLLGQNEVFSPDSEKNVPKVLLLHSNYIDNKRSNQLVYNESKNLVYDRLKKNIEKLDIQILEGNNKQFVHQINTNHIEIIDKRKNSDEISTQTDFIVLLQSSYKTAIPESSDLLITAFNGCNKTKLTETRIQYRIENNWIKNDRQFIKIDSILLQFLFNSLLENNLVIKKGKELNCLIEFNEQDTSQPYFFKLKKQELQDSIENWIMNNSIENQYELIVKNAKSVQFNSIRMPLFFYSKGVCVDESVFFESITKLIPNSELILQNLPEGINAVIRVNL